MFKLEFGEILKDAVTGFVGVVMGRTEYTTGCKHYGLLSRKLVDGKITDWIWLDENRLSRTGKKVNLHTPKREPGGPMPNAPEM